MHKLGSLMVNYAWVRRGLVMTDSHLIKKTFRPFHELYCSRPIVIADFHIKASFQLFLLNFTMCSNFLVEWKARIFIFILP